MNYQLFEKASPSNAVAQAAFSDDFEAEKWARKWAQDNGDGEDFLIKRADGGLSAHLFRTVGGQWFIMRQ